MGSHVDEPVVTTRDAPRHRPRLAWLWWALGAMAGLVLLAVIAVYASGETLGGMAGLPAAPERGLEAAVHNRFADAGAEDVVVLADVITFEWDTVGVFGPYYSHEEVAERMAVRVPQGATNNLLYDERCLLVFRDEGRMAAWTVVSRDVAECAAEASGQLYARDEARFRGDHLSPATTR
jgi:hypothetical protein